MRAPPGAPPPACLACDGHAPPAAPGSPEADPATPLATSGDAVVSGIDPTVLERYQVDAFLKAAAQNSGKGLMGRMFGRSNSGKGGSTPGGEGTSEGPSVEDMFTYSATGIPCSLTKLSADGQSKAVKLFDNILKYVDSDSLTPSESVLLAQKILQSVLKRNELRDEIYAQLMKQTRANPSVESQTKCWELLFLVASTSPPSKEFTAYTSEYVHSCAHSEAAPDKVKQYAERAWKSLRTTAKSGARALVPSPEEIEAAKVNRRLTTIVFFLDDTFEELTYDLTTTVIDGVEALSRMIRLQNYQTFSFFAARKVVVKRLSLVRSDAGEEEERHVFLDDNRYIADIIAEFRSSRVDKREPSQCKLLFKKRMFRETDEAISEPMFINLSYVQAQHDYLLGNYPVGREDACQLAALQVHADQGTGLVDNMQGLDEMLDRYFSRQTLMTRPREDWVNELNSRYKTLEHFTKDDARMQMLRILRALPYGNSIFFPCKRIEDPIGLLPGKLVLGINKRGVHFFRPNPKEYLHSAELRDIPRRRRPRAGPAPTPTPPRWVRARRREPWARPAPPSDGRRAGRAGILRSLAAPWPRGSRHATGTARGALKAGAGLRLRRPALASAQGFGGGLGIAFWRSAAVRPAPPSGSRRPEREGWPILRAKRRELGEVRGARAPRRKRFLRAPGLRLMGALVKCRVAHPKRRRSGHQFLSVPALCA